MTCSPTIKVKEFANKYKHIFRKLGMVETKFDDDTKFIVMKLINYSIKKLGIKDAANLVYNFFPNIIVEKIMAHLNNYESSYSEVIQELDDDNFDDQIESSSSSSEKPWLIKFYSTKCSHCIEFQPIWKKVPSAIQDMNFGEVSLDEGRQIIKRYGIETLPYILLLKPGEKPYSIVNGSYTIENIVDFVQHPETYNDRSDIEIDCSNIIKNLIHHFSLISKDKEYLYRNLKFQKNSETLASLSKSLSRRRL
jgi:thiol-disulfide isomerase/thioredoxin